VDYHPEPIPTAGRQLGRGLHELTERLAKNTHDVWARQRFADGWKYGPRRDDAAKEHPGLVPYEQLPESEKKYDRETAIESLKAVVALGYRIEKDGLEGTRPSLGFAGEVAEVRAAVRSPSPPYPLPEARERGEHPTPAKVTLPWDPAVLADDEGSPGEPPQMDAIRRRVELFNRDADDIIRRHPAAVVQSMRDLLSEGEESALRPGAKVVLERYAVADQLAQRYRFRTTRAFRDLFLAALLAMTAFEVAGHGFHGEIGHHVRPILLGLYLVLWLVAGVRWRIAAAGDYQNRHLDYRALAEGLRVQFFWRVLGICDAVEEHYLGQQRSELEWIRYALREWRIIDAARFPAGDDGSAGDQDLARRRWVQGQLEYFTRAAPREEVKARNCRRDGKLYFAINVIAVLILIAMPSLGRALSYGEHESVGFGVAEAVVFVIAGLALVASALRLAFAERMAFAEHAKEYEAIRRLCLHAEERLAAGETLEPFRELGREALSENGDWLLTHRERPLEVPIP
jgi:hypothetical protein